MIKNVNLEMNALEARTFKFDRRSLGSPDCMIYDEISDSIFSSQDYTIKRIFINDGKIELCAGKHGEKGHKDGKLKDSRIFVVHGMVFKNNTLYFTENSPGQVQCCIRTIKDGIVSTFTETGDCTYPVGIAHFRDEVCLYVDRSQIKMVDSSRYEILYYFSCVI